MKKVYINSFVVLFVLTLLSKFFGFLKTTLIAALYGMSEQTDIYNLADSIVNQLLYAFAVSIAIMIIPLYLKKKSISVERGKRFIKSAYYSLWACVIILLFILLGASPLIASIFGGNYTDEQLHTLSMYMRILSIGIVLSIITNALQSLLNAEHIYGFPSICALLNSIIIILFTLLFSRSLGLWGVIWATPVAFIIQTIFLRIKSKKFLQIKIRKENFDRDIKYLFINIIPVFLSNATMDLNGLFDKYLLTSSNGGAITAVTYANVLLVFATNIITIPLTTVLFTDVSELIASGYKDEVKKMTEHYIITIIFLCIPIMIIFIFCSYQIVDVVFGYGKYDNKAVSLTAQILSIYGISIVFYVIKDAINRIAFALLEMKIPLFVSFCSVLIHILASLFFYKRIGMIGIILGSVLGVVFLAIVTFYLISKKHLHCNFRMYSKSLWKIGISSVLMIISVSICHKLIGTKFDLNQVGSFISLLISSCVGGGGYLLFLLVTKESFLIQIINKFLKKNNKTLI